MSNDFTDITKLLVDYTEEVTEAITEEAISLGKQGASKAKQSSPKGARKKYAKGWTTSVKKGRNFINVKVHNRTDYQLTHLLEFGHATRNGGRTRPQPHIQPIEAEVNELFVKNVKKIIQDGGKR